MTAAGLALRARSVGLTAADVADALDRERTIVRGWLMRGTLHLVAAQDFGWLLSLLGPIFLRADARRRAQLGVTDDLVARATRLIRRALAAEGPLTRSQLVERLARHGLKLEPRSQAPIHLISAAALSGVLCLGPSRGPEATYVLIEDWVEGWAVRSAETALAELARRYFAAYGPATVEDLASWSGIPAAMARAAHRAVAAELLEVEVGDRVAWLTANRAAELRVHPARDSAVRLLPSFDTYMLGYASRALSTPPSLEARLQRGGGWIHPALIIDGRAVGTWRLERKGGGGEVSIEAVGALSRTVRTAVGTEVDDIGRFLALPVSCRYIH